MKKLFFVATLGIAGLMSAGGGTVALPTQPKLNSKTLFKALFAEDGDTKCYRRAVDPFGNPYYVEVRCPRVVILK